MSSSDPAWGQRDIVQAERRGKLGSAAGSTPWSVTTSTSGASSSIFTSGCPSSTHFAETAGKGVVQTRGCFSGAYTVSLQILQPTYQLRGRACVSAPLHHVPLLKTT